MGDALRIAGNFTLSWRYCRDNGIDPRSADGAAILAQRTPSALILCGGKNLALVEEVRTLYRERRDEAAWRLLSYKNRGLAPPSSHRYA